MSAYYNENDPFAAQWLRNLISAGHIAPGDVDERSIEDVKPDEIRHHTQCHFFAGVGVWSYALRQAGWPDDRSVWTGSCPCQPFSAAGKGGGFADERHLWPAFFHLIGECAPGVVLGEQVASKDGLAWLDLVQTDMEAAGYVFGALDMCAAGFGAPHIRQRAYWVANNNNTGREGRGRVSERHAECAVGQSGVAGGLADSDNAERRADCTGRDDRDGSYAGRPQGASDAKRRCGFSGLADNARSGRREERANAGRRDVGDRAEGIAAGFGASVGVVERLERPGPTNGFWRDADWLHCRDEKWRPVESGSFPLVDGAPARVGRLRAYGNAIVAPQAIEFIRAAKDAIALSKM